MAVCPSLQCLSLLHLTSPLPHPHPDSGQPQHPSSPYLAGPTHSLSAHSPPPPLAARRQPLASRLCHFRTLPIPGPFQHYPAKLRLGPQPHSLPGPCSPLPGLSGTPSVSAATPAPFPLSHQKTSPNTPQPHLSGLPPALLLLPILPPLLPQPRPSPSQPLGPSQPPAPLPSPPLWTAWAGLENNDTTTARTRTERRAPRKGWTRGPGGSELAGAGPRAACRSFPQWLPGGGSGQVASCTDTDAPYLLLAVKSEPGRFAERQAVRETWGGPAPGIRLLFLLGSPVGDGGPDLGSLVAWESHRYSDLLLWDFLDVPFNQTLKDLLLLAWLDHHCPGVSFVLQAQDDAFVHTPALLDHLRALPPTWARGLYLGEVFTQAKPLRKPGGPFYVPGSFFEGGYPAYASGGGYVIAGRLAPWLLQAAARVAPFPFDDVYTGLCFQALGLVPRAHKGFLTAWPADRTADPCTLRDLLLVRPLSPQDSIRLWKHLRDPQLQC
ncbi:UDP-GlcNAc:betaGal beta-1,3-N-acetylglucosaminyltransferase 8 isoform X2 [Equus asinus]|uniref:UDP-GlcNAc:betaGal beta-1,3-N-acetylglucosaminyltransferase 8 isoform X2 n=1 Tax=Equus asinus TaxID=9793 RepID=UPI001D050A9E|nr:UDP-GlcNAc:betaGal beta-1,3-N-acetylglucosaminyltransferase 8 isoform X2 [Equus asinus]